MRAKSVAVEAVGYLLEELRNPATLEAFKADVASANIFIGSLIFVQELADKVTLFLGFHAYYPQNTIERKQIRSIFCDDSCHKHFSPSSFFVIIFA
jgi:Domain of unknown function (DUF3479)